MDNKITKRRLYNFLSYEWIVMIVAVVAAIIAWNLIFTMTSVKLTVGQDYKFFIDETIDSSNEVYNLLKTEDGKTVFSYDVLKVGHETLFSEYNVLKERMSVQEGDLIITDCTEPAGDEEDKSVRAKTIIDTYLTYDFISLKEDAEDYLADLLKDEHINPENGTALADVTDYNNLDESKIEELFRNRMKRDNRYRSENQKLEGIALEKERIKNLCNEVKKFRHLLCQGDEYFLMYQRYEQIWNELDDSVKERYENDKYRSKGTRPYGLKVGALQGGENPSKYFKKAGTDNSNDVVILVFDLKDYQPHLQFESIAFINAIVDGCSNLYEGI